MISYVYQLEDPVLGMAYIGSRKEVPSITEDSKYVGSVSSKAWRKQWKEISARCTKTILFVFETFDEALECEAKLHDLYNVDVNERFFNKAKQTSTSFQCRMPGKENPMHSKAAKDKVSDAMKGRDITWKEKLRAAQTGKKMGPASEERKRKIAESLMGVPKPTVKCDVCGKVGAVANMSRWHFNNCKDKNDVQLPR